MKVNLNLQQIVKGFSDFDNFTQILEQSKNESLLYKNPKWSGKDVNWNKAFVALKEKNGTVFVTVQNAGHGRSQQSKIPHWLRRRKQSGAAPLPFKFVGGEHQNRFFVADTFTRPSLGKDKIVMAPTDKLCVTFFPLKGENRGSTLNSRS